MPQNSTEKTFVDGSQTLESGLSFLDPLKDSCYDCDIASSGQHF